MTEVYSLEMDSIKISTSNLILPKRAQFHETCVPQEFSLSRPIMKYIWESHSSPTVYQKLIQCCKLLFIKNPVLIMDNLDYFEGLGWTNCIEKTCCVECMMNHKYFDMDKIKANIWLTNKISIDSQDPSNVSSDFIRKIYRFDVEELKLYRQQLTYEELQFLSTGVKLCTLGNNIVKYKNGENVAVENILKLFSNSKQIKMYFDTESTESAVCKSYANFIDACFTIEEVIFYHVPTGFDAFDFYQHLKTSGCHTLFQMFSFLPLNRINKVVDEILQTESFDFVPPVIGDDDIDYSLLNRMEKIRDAVAAKLR